MHCFLNNFYSTATPLTISMHKNNTYSCFAATILLFLLLATSCTSYRKVPMMQNSRDVNTFVDSLNALRFKPKDQIYIRVMNTEEPTSASLFNLSSLSPVGADGRLGYSSGYTLYYEVDNEGNIEFPMLGTLHVAGMSRDQLADYIASRIEGQYLKVRPEVAVRLANFHVSVIGQVNSPGRYEFNREPVTIFDALSKASDLEIHGRRYNVKVVRENAKGEKTVGVIDLTDANCVNSPYYFMQQNDVVYVEPNTPIAKNSGVGVDTQYWFRAVSVLLSVASLTYRIVR